MAAAAQQPVDRLAARLADQVPQRDLDAADGRHHRRARPGTGRESSRRSTASMSNGSRPSTRPSTHSWSSVCDRLLLPFERRLADAREAGVGAQADEQVVPQPGVGEERLRSVILTSVVPRPDVTAYVNSGEDRLSTLSRVITAGYPAGCP